MSVKSMYKALMEMATPKTERAAWVPESIADEQVEAFMEAAIAAIKEGADTFVFEGKHYKANKKESKLDPVGKADADIDNDGDVDSSDKYLHKRRKAIKKSMAKEEVVDEATKPRIELDKKGAHVKNSDGTTIATFTMKNDPDFRKKAQAYLAKHFDKLSHSGGTNEEVREEMDPTKHVKEKDGKYCVYNAEGKEVAKFDNEKSANAYARKHHDELMGDKDDDDVSEGKAPNATAKHGPDDPTSDSYVDQIGNGSGSIPKGNVQDFLNQHPANVALDAEEEYKKNQREAEAALKRTPPRLGDQRTGDNSFVNPIKAEIIDGIKTALEKMKTNS